MSPWKIGHRGASAHAPENTLLAFRKAFDLGADGIECDVHRCKSGEAVVIHDATLKRTTGMRGRVSALTLAELRALNAGEGEVIPTLEETIEAAGRHIVFIEIKSAAAVAPVAKTIAAFARGDASAYARLPVIAFHGRRLREIQRLDPRILTGVTPPEKHMPRRFAARAQAAGMWSINPAIGLLTPALVEEAHMRGLKVITWTANTPREIARAKALGVDGIMSDYPERL